VADLSASLARELCTWPSAQLVADFCARFDTVLCLQLNKNLIFSWFAFALCSRVCVAGQDLIYVVFPPPGAGLLA
jgi:hypothetical protein